MQGIEVERIFDGDKEYCEEARHRCQTDHFFLAPLLGFDKFVESIHRPAAELYVQKKPGLSIEDQDPIKKRMHLDPRHTYKTTMGFVDTVQWVITFPDITILNETATQPLANALTTTIAWKFHQKKGAQLTAFQKLWPEYVVQGKPEDGEYNAPCRTFEQPDKTIMSTSVNTAQSGWHPWIINPDDAVDTTNSGIDASENRRRKVINNHNTNVNALRLGGYVHFRGTRYHPFDLYGETLRKMNKKSWKLLIRGSLIVKNGERLVEGDFPGADDVELLFPELLSYDDLLEKFTDDYRSFMCQQMNDASGGAVLTFPQTLYDQAKTESHHIPSMGDVEVCWRLPYEGKEFMAKYAEGVAVRYLGSRVYVVDAWRGNYMPSELNEKIINSCRKHSSHKLIIERTPGAEYVIPHIENESIRRSWRVQIEQPEFQMNDAERNIRCKSLQPMMKSGRLRLSTSAGQQIEMASQFVNFGLIAQNGIIDCISRLALRIPASVMTAAVTEEQKEIYRAVQGNAQWAAVYGGGGATVVEDAISSAQQTTKRKNSYGLRSIMGGLDG